MLKRLLVTLVFLASLRGNSQSIAKSMRLAGKYVDAGDFAKGAAEYQKVLAKDSNYFYANQEYGLLLFEYMNEPAKAGRYLIKAEKTTKKDTMPELLFGLGKYYHFTGDYTKALYYYKRFHRYIDLKDKDGISLEQDVNSLIANCRYGLEHPAAAKRKRLRVLNGGPGLNTIYPEYVPVLSGDKKTLMFTSRRKISEDSKIDEENGGFYENMYSAQRDASGKFVNPKPFSLQANRIPGTTHSHESAISLSYVGDRFFTFYDGKIYESRKEGGSWSSPAVLNNDLNDASEFRNHVCISHDGNVLIYSAERPNGIGGLDLYRSVKGTNGKWSAGENMGPDINTKEDEGGPVLNEDGTVLYFSSKGWPGYGGYDFFKTRFENGKWSLPENLGEPLNSAGDDIYISINNEETEGFLSSSRAGGVGDMDLYEIGYRKPFEDFKPDAEGRLAIVMPDTVYTGDTEVMKVVINKVTPADLVAFNWLIGDSVMQKGVEGTEVKYRFDRAGETVVKVEGDHAPSGDFIGAEKKLFVIERPATAVASNTVSTTVNSLPPLETVYFDLNKADINAEAARVLDRDLEALKAHPGIRIEIAGYCDARGSAAYNRALSQRRVVAARNYLVKKGLAVKIVKKTGFFGEGNPINRCADGVDCTEEEYRLNRRVEFKWVEGNR
jgi:outer membrane protein OmpA-like peptidoglycan-associated protein/tetratricopeptide (TPR) repeat protein